MNQRLSLLYKILCFHVFFILIHYLYDWFPNTLTHFFGATNESVYQHMKAMFYACALLAFVEYLFTHKAITNQSRFIFARLFETATAPLFMLPFFLLSPALFVKIESIPLEILFANLALLCASTCTFILGSALEYVGQPRRVQVVILAIFIISAVEFSIFNTRLPWFDIFAIPPGW